MADYEVGYGKPPKHTRWVKGGPSPNPGGKTREHRLAEIRAAELAAKVQLDLVEALSNAMDESTGNEAKLAQIRADVLKLLKDSQDRGFGAPTQPTEISNPDGSLNQGAAVGAAVLEAIKAKHESDG